MSRRSLKELILEVVPHVGMLPIRFGMTKGDVIAILGRPNSEHPNSTFHGGLQVNYDDQGGVLQLGLNWNPTDGPKGRYAGRMVFDLQADDLIEVLRRDAGEPPRIGDGGTGVTFHSLDLSLWRPTTPEEYGADDPEDEYRNGRYWMSVELHRPGLLREMDIASEAK